VSELIDAPAHAQEAASEPEDEIVEQIKRLCDLRDRELVTAEHFLVRRAQILGRPQR
jgi:hypothetical protein